MSPKWLYVRAFEEPTIPIPPFGDPQEVSVEQASNTENLRKASDVDVGIGDVWTISAWVKAAGSATGDRVVDIVGTGSNANFIRFQQRGSPANSIQMDTFNSAGSNFLKSYLYNGALPTNTWVFVVVTWNGTSLLTYFDGSFTAADTKFADNAGAMVSTNRQVGVGSDPDNTTANFIGKLHSCAIWDVVLSTNAITELYAGGAGETIDYASDIRNYTDSANLLHWWRIGHDSGDIGKDSGVHTTLIDIMDDAVNVTADDIVVDYPGL
jgi:hypothetical protein